MERIPADSWQEHFGHVDRYEYAIGCLLPGDVVNDVACGVGYAAAILPAYIEYHGYDRPGIPDERFPGMFHAVDLNDVWYPWEADVTLSFETLEHVVDPEALAATMSRSTRRSLIVSAPTQPTKETNPFHLHDFTIEEIPPLFPGWKVVDLWEQPQELCHVWRFKR